MDEREQAQRAQVVVGVDGSPASRRALTFAAGEARQRAAGLTVVTSFEVPDILWLGHPTEPRALEDRLEVAQRASRKVVDDELSDQSGLDIKVVATTAAPTVALIDLSAGADLLVVGSRGRGGFRGLIMGSVSMQCVLHARCPVVVVRADYLQHAASDGGASRADSAGGGDHARRETTATFQ
jgi:nucleotide-binding universal stress UspA family protein